MGITDEQHHFIRTASENEELMQEMEKTDPNVRIRMAAMLLSRWIPVGIIRKTLMLIFIIVGSLGLYFSGSLWFLFCFLIAVSFSPRIVGNFFIFLGSMQQSFDEGRKNSKNST